MELTEEQKKELLTEFIEKTKASLAKEAQPAIEEIKGLITGQRVEYDKLLEGKITAADYKAFEEKSLAAEKLIQERVDKIETKMARPPIEKPGEEELKEGQVVETIKEEGSFETFIRKWKIEEISPHLKEIELEVTSEKYSQKKIRLVLYISRELGF